MTPIDLKRLRELCLAATPGPWRDTNGNGAASVVTEHPDYACQIYLNVRTCEIKDTVDRWQADARFIAAANPTTVLALLDALDHAREKQRQAFYEMDCAHTERDNARWSAETKEKAALAAIAERDEAREQLAAANAESEKLRTLAYEAVGIAERRVESQFHEGDRLRAIRLELEDAS